MVKITCAGLLCVFKIQTISNNPHPQLLLLQVNKVHPHNVIILIIINTWPCKVFVFVFSSLIVAYILFLNNRMGNSKSKHRHNNNHNNQQNNNYNNNPPPPSSSSSSRNNEPPKFETIRDKYETYEQLQDALRASGLESSNLIIGLFVFIFLHMSLI